MFTAIGKRRALCRMGLEQLQITVNRTDNVNLGMQSSLFVQ